LLARPDTIGAHGVIALRGRYMGSGERAWGARMARDRTPAMATLREVRRD
jgi:hypothetical protein